MVPPEVAARRIIAAGITPLYAPLVLAAGAELGLPPEYGCVLLVKESHGGKHIYGHDTDAYPYLPRGTDLAVTEANYQEYLASIAAGGRNNGVGGFQLTHSDLQTRADELGGCWRPEINAWVALDHFARLRARHGDFGAFERWRGIGPGAAYATDAMARLPYWRDVLTTPLPEETPMSNKILVVQMGHVGRPPVPGSVGTAREQDNARKAADAVVRHVHGKAGWGVNVINADPDYGVNDRHKAMGGNPARYRGDAFAALHCDGSTSTSSRGASFGYQTSEGALFASMVWRAYVAGGWPASSLKPDNYTTALAQYYGVATAVRQGNRRAIIFEMGTTTNPSDRALLESAEGYDRVGRAVAVALGINIPAPAPAPEPIRREDLPMIDVVTSTEAGRTAVVVGGQLQEMTGPNDPAGKSGTTARGRLQQQINGGKLTVVDLDPADFAALVGPA
jgi:hypothetical protein